MLPHNDRSRRFDEMSFDKDRFFMMAHGRTTSAVAEALSLS